MDQIVHLDAQIVHLVDQIVHLEDKIVHLEGHNLWPCQTAGGRPWGGRRSAPGAPPAGGFGFGPSREYILAMLISICNNRIVIRNP